MLVPKLHYISTQLTHTLRHLYCETSFCMHSLKKVAAKPFIQSCTMSFVSRSLLRLWVVKISWGGETSDNYLVQGGNHMGHPWKPPTWTVSMPTLFIVHNSPAFFDHPTPLPHTPFIPPSPQHFINMTVNFCKMNIVSV